MTVCPDTIITFTCSDTLVFGMEWSALPLLNEDNSPALAADIVINLPIVVKDVFTITLEAKRLRSDFRGNYTSTLDVVVNDTIGNGTTVTCFTPSTMASLIIVKQSKNTLTIVKYASILPLSFVIALSCRSPSASQSEGYYS